MWLGRWNGGGFGSIVALSLLCVAQVSICSSIINVMKRLLIGIILALAVFVGWFLYSASRNKAIAPTVEQSTSMDSKPTANSADLRLIIGDPAAKVGIIQYSDPQCPICKRFFEQTEPQLLREYIDTGKAYLEVRVETHIGAASVLAGQAWHCASDQGKFKAMHDETFRGQTRFTAAILKAMATTAGLNRAEFDTCLDSGKHQATVAASNKEAQSRISGTPTFFIGYSRINGAQPFSIFKTTIDAQ